MVRVMAISPYDSAATTATKTTYLLRVTARIIGIRLSKRPLILPYTFWMAVIWTLLFVAWYLLGLPW